MKDSSSLNFLEEIRFFIVKLCVGKKSIIGNCKLVNVEVIVDNHALIYNCDIFYGKKMILDRVSGTTLRPKKIK